MSYRKAKETMQEFLYTGYPFVHVTTEDDTAAILGLKKVILNTLNTDENSSFDLVTWNLADGIYKEINKGLGNTDKGLDYKEDDDIKHKFSKLFKYIDNYSSNAVFVIQNINLCYEDKTITSELKELIAKISKSINKNHEKLGRYNKSNDSFKMIYVLSDKVNIPDELNKVVTVMEYGLPGKEDLGKLLSTFITEKNIQISFDEKDKIIEAGIGLTENEFANAVFNSYIRNSGRKVDVMEVASLKEQIVKKGGIIQFFKTNIKMSDIGGLENLMDWVKKREIAFNEEVRNVRKLKFPKGILMTGIPGCGKSESVKAIATHLQLPLLRLDTGSLMGKWVGETDANTRKAIALAESIAPAVLWIDEIEKAFPDPRNSNTHEVSNRLMSFFLTWLQEKKSEVFVIATANNIDKLPPELLRKGRFSEIFFVNLPKEKEREKIFKIHLERIGVTLTESEIKQAAADSTGFSGAEIEETVQEANFQSAYEGKPLSITYLVEEIKKTTPLSVIMGDKLKEIERWAKENKVRQASAE